MRRRLALEATVIYPHTQVADGIKLARLVAQGKNMSDLTSKGVPRRIVLDAPVVTSYNVDQFIDNASSPHRLTRGRRVRVHVYSAAPSIREPS